jgi:hypothetical protein
MSLPKSRPTPLGPAANYYSACFVSLTASYRLYVPGPLEWTIFVDQKGILKVRVINWEISVKCCESTRKNNESIKKGNESIKKGIESTIISSWNFT